MLPSQSQGRVVDPSSPKPSPPHTPHSSSTNVDPHVLSQPDGAASKHPQPKSSALPPSHTPQSSNVNVPPHVPAQSCTQSFELSSSHTPQLSNVAVEPQALSQPDGAASKHPQPKSSALPPLQTLQSS